MKAKTAKRIAIAVITLSAMLAFAPNLSSEFLLDDQVLIVNNPFIRQIESVSTYLAQEDGIVDRDDYGENYHTRYYRPLINFTYHLDYRLWGLNPTGFHLTNWLLHLATALLLFRLLVRVSGNVWASLLTVLLFTVHPVQTESVSWIASRNNILATFFSLACFDSYISARGRRTVILQALALLFFLLAMFSKEFGVMLLPILFTYDRIFLKKSLLPDRTWFVYLPFILALCFYLAARSMVTGPLLGTHEGVAFTQRLLFSPYLAMYNLRLIFIPLDLHNFLVSYPDKQTWLYMSGGGIGLALLSALLWYHRNNRLLLFGVFSFLIGLFPVLNIISMSAVTLVAMRWLYFPMAFLAFAAAGTIGHRPGRIKTIVLLLLTMSLGSYSFYLNREHWQGEKRFFTREAVQFNNMLYAGAYAKILSKSGIDDLSYLYFQKGIEAFPTLVGNYINYSATLIDRNLPEKALAVVDTGLQFESSKTKRGLLYNNKGMALSMLGRIDAAIAAFEKSLRYSPRNVNFVSNLGSAYGMKSDYGRAVKVFLGGLQAAPDSIGIRKNLAYTYFQMAEYQKTIQILEAIPAVTRAQRPAIAGLLGQARDLAGRK
jgi:tetratricopeptide (TPR) repeat protein